MSQNIQLGIAAVCGGVTYGLSSVANLSSGIGIAFAIAAFGVVLILLSPKETSVEETVASKKSRKEKKSAPSPQKAPNKAPKTPKVELREEPAEVPETPSKKKKKGKKNVGTPISSPVSPQPVKSKGKVEEDKEDKEKSKAQLRKLKKKEAEQKQKAEEEKQRAAEIAKKAADQKREAAQQKKLQAKARKASQKAPQETKAETKVELKQQSLAPEPGWEVNTNRKLRGPKDGKESKEPIVIDVKIPVRSHALIIGKQGEGLRKLTEDLDVIITMPKRDSGNDLILIKGLPKDVHMAKRALEELATKGYSSVTQPGWVTKIFPLQNKYQLSLVFGEKGSTLQKISQVSGTRLQMPEKGTDNLQLSVTGDERAIDHAFSLIQELIDQGYSKTTHPDWVADEIHVGEQAMGAIIGVKAARLKELTKQFKVKIDIPRRGDDPTVKNETLYVKGPKRQVALLKQEIANILASREAPVEQEVPDPAWQEEVQEVSW